MTGKDWALLFTGIALGGTDEFFTNWSHSLPCGADITLIIESLYFVGLYGYYFYITNNSQNIVYLILYLAYGSTPVADNRCSILTRVEDRTITTSPVVGKTN